MSRPNDLTPEQVHAEQQLFVAITQLQTAIEEAGASGLLVEFKQNIVDGRPVVSLSLGRCPHCRSA